MTNQHETEVTEALAAIEAGSDKPFAVCSGLADKIAELMEAGDPCAGAFLERIERIYTAARAESQRLPIDNGFLFQLGNRIFSHREGTRLLQMLPKHLHDALMHQMLSTGP